MGVNQCFQGETAFFKITGTRLFLFLYSYSIFAYFNQTLKNLILARDEFGTKCTRGGEKFDVVMVDGLWLANWQMDRTYQSKLKRKEELLKLLIEKRDAEEEKKKQENEAKAKAIAEGKATENEEEKDKKPNNDGFYTIGKITIEEVTKTEGGGGEEKVEESKVIAENSKGEVEKLKESSVVKEQEKVDTNPNSQEALTRWIRRKPVPWDAEEIEFLDIINWFDYYKATRHLPKRTTLREWNTMCAVKRGKTPLDENIKLESTRQKNLTDNNNKENKDSNTATTATTSNQQQETSVENEGEWIDVEMREWDCWQCTLKNAPGVERCVVCNAASPLYLLDHVDEVPKSSHFDSISVLGNHDGTYLVSYTPLQSGMCFVLFSFVLLCFILFAIFSLVFFLVLH